MTDIKIVISLLCKHLNFLFDMHIKPEMFRLAKYNKSDDNIVEMFWSLLSKITEQSTEKNVVQNIKRYFLVNLKYENLQLYSLPENMSCGSRELLIAFAYLLAQDYLNKFIKTAIIDSPINPNVKLKSNDCQYKSETYSFNLKQLKTEKDFENAMQWIRGRIKYNKRAVQEYENCFEKMSVKISKTTSKLITTSQQLSFSEVLALNNVERGKIFLEKTERVSNIVQNHQRWLKNQAVFWDWMNSVLLERQKNLPMTNPEEIDKFFVVLNEI